MAPPIGGTLDASHTRFQHVLNNCWGNLHRDNSCGTNHGMQHLDALRQRRQSILDEIEQLRHELKELDVAERVIIGLEMARELQGGQAGVVPEKAIPAFGAGGVIGRDVEALMDRTGGRWDTADFVWGQNAFADTLRVSLTNKVLTLLQSLSSSGVPSVTAPQLAGLIASFFKEEVDTKSVSTILARLTARGDVERVSGGQYRAMHSSGLNLPDVLLREFRER